MIVTRALPLAITVAASGLTMSSSLLLLHPTDPGLIAVTVQLMLLLAELSMLWLLRPRPSPALVPAPPWGRIRPTRLRHPEPHPADRWALARLQLRDALLDAPPPLPAQPAPPRRAARAANRPTPISRSPRPRLWRAFRRPTIRLLLPTLDIEFVAPGRRPVRQVNEPLAQSTLLQLTESVLHATLAPPCPAVLALHDHPQQLTLQYATNVLLTTAQQRAVVDGLRQQGVIATWSDVASLTVRREALRVEPPSLMPGGDTLWVPVLTQRQTTSWWPLPRQQHLLLAGQSVAPLAGLLQRIQMQEEPERPPLLIHDPDGRLRDLDDRVGRLVEQPDALNQARQLQLQYRFAQERVMTTAPWVPPLCVIVEPTVQIWPEVQPLLDPDSGVQVVLILGSLPPIPQLRALCYRLPVIEIAQALTPLLPETFRPASVPVPRPGQAVAWMQGGSVWWRGRAPEIECDVEVS